LGVGSQASLEERKKSSGPDGLNKDKGGKQKKKGKTKPQFRVGRGEGGSYSWMVERGGFNLMEGEERAEENKNSLGERGGIFVVWRGRVWGEAGEDLI